VLVNVAVLIGRLELLDDISDVVDDVVDIDDIDVESVSDSEYLPPFCFKLKIILIIING